MRYPTGQTVHVGDLVELAPGRPGRIVCALDEREFSDDYRREDWSYLERGVLIRAAGDALVHCARLPGSLRLVQPVGR